MEQSKYYILPFKMFEVYPKTILWVLMIWSIIWAIPFSTVFAIIAIIKFSAHNNIEDSYFGIYVIFCKIIFIFEAIIITCGVAFYSVSYGIKAILLKQVMLLVWLYFKAC